MTADQLDDRLRELTGWALREGKLHREFKFRDFVEAFGFTSKVALHAQSIDHHPEWSNVYNAVTIDLRTHEVGAISQLDVELARRIDRASSNSQPLIDQESSPPAV